MEANFIRSVEMRSQETPSSYFEKALRYFHFVILAGTLLATNLSAQGDSSLWGSVTDASDAGIPGATVSITNLETGTARNLVTDEAGRFNAPALSVGHYEISASKAGFTDRRTSVSLVVGQREQLDLKLQV
jgi:hypothetical protein